MSDYLTLINRALDLQNDIKICNDAMHNLDSFIYRFNHVSITKKVLKKTKDIIVGERSDRQNELHEIDKKITEYEDRIQKVGGKSED